MSGRIQDIRAEQITAINTESGMDVTAEDVQMSGKLAGIENDKFTGICMSNVTIALAEKPKKVQWNFSNIEGVTSWVNPQACDLLPDKQPGKVVPCPFPTNKLLIDDVELKICSIRPKPPRYIKSNNCYSSHSNLRFRNKIGF
ncbi:hypothetical protein SOVF_107920 [Spinacia oleracea]|nr:hypothetical protein SOVF_107920 [Spinacia oleracea]